MTNDIELRLNCVQLAHGDVRQAEAIYAFVNGQTAPAGTKAPKAEKPKAEAPKAEEPAKADPPKVEEPKAEAAGQALTYADHVKPAVMRLVKAKGSPVALQVITSFDVDNAQKVPEARWPEFLAALEAAANG